MRSVVALVFAGVLVAGLWAATPAQASVSATKWPHWNETAKADLQVGCPELATMLGAAKAEFESVPGDQGLKGKLKKAFARAENQLKAGNAGPIRAVCAQAGFAVAPATTTTTAPPKPIFYQTGNGIQTTTTFTVPSEWVLNYNYDCSSEGSGNFIVDVYDSDGTPDFNATGVNELGAGGSGTQNFHADPGVKYLEINSECNWAVNIPPGGGANG